MDDAAKAAAHAHGQSDARTLAGACAAIRRAAVDYGDTPAAGVYADAVDEGLVDALTSAGVPVAPELDLTLMTLLDLLIDPDELTESDFGDA